MKMIEHTEKVSYLKQLLKEKGITERMLADKCNLDITTVCRYCQAQREPKVTVAIRIAKILRVNVEDIWDV